MEKRFAILLCLGYVISFTLTPVALAIDADNLVKAGFDYWRGNASIATVMMTIHRPDWERKMTI